MHPVTSQHCTLCFAPRDKNLCSQIKDFQTWQQHLNDCHLAWREGSSPEVLSAGLFSPVASFLVSTFQSGEASRRRGERHATAAPTSPRSVAWRRLPSLSCPRLNALISYLSRRLCRSSSLAREDQTPHPSCALHLQSFVSSPPRCVLTLSLSAARDV